MDQTITSNTSTGIFAPSVISMPTGEQIEIVTTDNTNTGTLISDNANSPVYGEVTGFGPKYTDIKAKDYVLQWACYYGHVDIVRSIIEKKIANINEDDGEALKAAIEGKHPEVIHYLLKKGADWKLISELNNIKKKEDVLKYLQLKDV